MLMIIDRPEMRKSNQKLVTHARRAIKKLKWHYRVNEGSCDKAALKECEDGKLTTSSRRLFHKLQTDTKKED